MDFRLRLNGNIVLRSAPETRTPRSPAGYRETLSSLPPGVPASIDPGPDSASFSKSWKLDAHICKHTGLKPFPCVDCDLNFCTSYQLTRHQLSHSGDKPHRCQADGCVEAFVSRSSMNKHMEKTHQNHGKPYKCGHQGCGKNFSKRHQLKTHTYEHTKLMPFPCTTTGCSRAFLSLGRLDHHKKFHQGYPCEEDGCPFQGKTWSAYQLHKKEHRVKAQCDVCQKHFVDRFLLLHKRRVHQGAKKVLLCPNKCGKSFTQKFNLESHVLTAHKGVRNFSCVSPGCGKSFAMKESLWRHSVVHDPERNKLKKQPLKNNSNGHKAVPAKPGPAKPGPGLVEGCALAARLGRARISDS